MLPLAQRNAGSCPFPGGPSDSPKLLTKDGALCERYQLLLHPCKLRVTRVLLRKMLLI